MNVCCFTPPYYTAESPLDDQRFSRLRQTGVDKLYHLYRGTAQPTGPIAGATHIAVTDQRGKLSGFKSFVSAIRAQVAQNDIHLLYCFDYRLLPPVAFAAVTTRTPLVFECGVRWEHSFDKVTDRLSWLPLLNFLFRSGCIDETISLADHLSQSVRKLGAKNPTTVYPLENKEPFLSCTEAQQYPEEYVVLYVGRISPEKGPHHLLARYDELDRDNVGLHFIGDNINDLGERTALAERLQKRASNDDQIHYHGWVEYGDLPPYYRGADIVTLPSSTEGFPAVVAEAFATETPVVCSDIPAFREIIDSTLGKIAAPESPVFTDAIASLLADDRQREAMGAAGRQFVINQAEQSRKTRISLLKKYE